MEVVKHEGCATVTTKVPDEPLFEAKRFYHSGDPETSKDAAEKMVKSGKREEQAESVRKAIQVYMLYCAGIGIPQNFTAKELSEHSGLDYHLIQRRRIDLDDELRWTGERRQDCRVWRVK